MAPSAGTVLVTHGLYREHFPIAGTSVGAVRCSLREAFNIGDDAKALISGIEVDDDHSLRAGERLEFIRARGVKGLGELLTPEQLQQRWAITREQYEDLVARGLPTLQFSDGSDRHPEVAVDQWIRVGFDLPSDLLTEAEAIRYLRLDTIKIADPAGSLRRYRDLGHLRGTQVSKRVFYRRGELDAFLVKLTDHNPR